MTRFVYLLQDCKYVDSNKKIYKLVFDEAKIKSPNTIILFQMIFDHNILKQKQIINQFNNRFKQIEIFGNDYYQGNYNSMINLIHQNIKTEIKYKFNPDKELIYKITTYDEWINYSEDIQQIIITNKKNHAGYLKFKGCLWRKLYNKKLGVTLFTNSNKWIIVYSPL